MISFLSLRLSLQSRHPPLKNFWIHQNAHVHWHCHDGSIQMVNIFVGKLKYTFVYRTNSTDFRIQLKRRFSLLCSHYKKKIFARIEKFSVLIRVSQINKTKFFQTFCFSITFFGGDAKTVFEIGFGMIWHQNFAVKQKIILHIYFNLLHSHQPWMAPLHVQQESDCYVGINYPRPMIDLKSAAARNRAAMDSIRESLLSGISVQDHCRPSNEDEIRQFFWLF
jgi:hypothetical protein